MRLKSSHFCTNNKEIIQHLSFVYHVISTGITSDLSQKNTAVFFWSLVTNYNLGRPLFGLASLCGSMFNHMADLIDSEIAWFFRKSRYFICRLFLGRLLLAAIGLMLRRRADMLKLKSKKILFRDVWLARYSCRGRNKIQFFLLKRERERFRPCLVRKNFQDSSPHRIFGRMHGELYIDENKN